MKIRGSHVAGAVLSLLSVGAQAQTRTWVSGVGDDVNPCSRTAPCKTFAGAISKTAAGGEINVLDSGGFGSVTITKAISIVADGVTAGVLAAGTNGIIVSAGGNDAVVLRGLDIEGARTGLNGIRFLSGASLLVEDCTINGFTQKGIDAVPSATSQLAVRRTAISNLPASTAISLAPGAAGSINAAIDDVAISRSLAGLVVADRSKVLVRRSTIAGTGNNGVLVAAATNPAAVVVEDSTISGVTSAAGAVAGVEADGAQALVTLSNVTVANCATNGVLESNSGQIQSFGNNRIVGNNPNIALGTTLGTLPQQ